MSRESEQIVGGKYRLVRPLAQGGMGQVWIARHIELEVEVALKFRADPSVLDTKGEARFKREAQAAAQLKSPYVVPIHDYGVDDGSPYIAMELLEGENLKQLLEREGRLGLERAAKLLGQAAKGLKRAHAAGIIHRDIKPSNLFLTRSDDQEIVKVLDFGIAKDQTSEARDGEEATTSLGQVLGSPGYMSPEQARGAPVDARSDLWSLAAVLFRMLTGEPPFVGANAHDVVIRICTEQPPSPSSLAPHLPTELDALFERAFALEPAERFQNADELVEAFDAVVRRHPNIVPPAGESPRPTPSGTTSSRKRAAVGRDTATESIRIDRPRADRTPGRQAERSRGVAYALVAVAVVVLAVVFWRASVGQELAGASAGARSEPSASPPMDSVQPPRSSPALAPSSTPAIVSATVEDGGSPAPIGSRSPNRPLKPGSQSSSSGRASASHRDASSEKGPAAIDPVFGLPVPPTQPNKR